MDAQTTENFCMIGRGGLLTIPLAGKEYNKIRRGKLASRKAGMGDFCDVRQGGKALRE